jgi:hypothetical protein
MAGGVGDRPSEEIVWDEKRRQDAVCAEGLGMSRVVWDELFGAARQRTLRRLESEYLTTCRRLGDRLPEHLARSAAELQGERARRLRRRWR